jgi:CRP/FNR family transcriptional regulator, anaerobic regulatory protein
MFKDPELQAALEREAMRRIFSAGEVLIHAGDRITHIPIVVSGSLRILAQNDQGQERFLYHIMPGESCAMSMTCCTGHSASTVVAVVEEDAELLMVPVRCMEEWMTYPEWRRFVSSTQTQRFTELLETIEVIAFSRLDDQLWNYLVKRVQATGEHTLKVTHQQIAQELNSPREVITRLLHQLQNVGRVTISRGSIEVHVSADWEPASEKGLKNAL